MFSVISAYINRSSLQDLTGSEPKQPKYLRLFLNDRYDFVRHFTISAGLAVNNVSELADAIGLYKDLKDSKGRSGFSFTELAADRAGVNFGEQATMTADSARRVQSLMSS